MKFLEVKSKSELVRYYFSDYEEPKYFKKIDKKIRKLKSLKVKKKERLDGIWCSMIEYLILGQEIYLCYDDVLGNFLTIRRKEGEGVLEMLVDMLKKME